MQALTAIVNAALQLLWFPLTSISWCNFQCACLSGILKIVNDQINLIKNVKFKVAITSYACTVLRQQLLGQSKFAVHSHYSFPYDSRNSSICLFFFCCIQPCDLTCGLTMHILSRGECWFTICAIRFFSTLQLLICAIKVSFGCESIQQSLYFLLSHSLPTQKLIGKK